MTAFILRRLSIAVLLLFAISLISFFIVTLTPGSPYPWGELNPKISEDVKRAFREKFHLDEPLHKQYFLIMQDLFSGKLRSIKDERSVLDKIAERLPATLALNAVSLLLSLSFGLLLGIYAARYYGRLPDIATSVLAFAFIALPGFWVSYLVAIGFSHLAGAPVLGLSSFGVVFPSTLSRLLDFFWHIAVPAWVLAIGGIAAQSRFLRATMVEALREDYIRTARAKGLSEQIILFKHALRNSLRPLITGIGLLLPAMVSGSVIVESIFAYPGIGRLGYEAVLERDYPTLVALNFIVAVLVLLGNLVSDILYAIVDPRVRLE
ncbi:MAG: ABC transporter permease [Chthoniobacterales bacterium]|nr:ABC transporter permease [Chthoniobacterales bacterium]